MDIKVSITVHSENAVMKATEITDKLKSENLRRTKVEQLTKPGRKDVLAPSPELMNVVKLLITSGFALGAVKGLLDILKGLLVELPKERIKAEVEKYKVDAEKSVKEEEIKSTEKNRQREIDAKKEVQLKELELRKAELDSNEELEEDKLELQQNYIEFNIEKGDKKYAFKLTKDDEQQQNDILKAIMDLEEL